jgi:EAL domain-containing protein (putative c-di-GMP-specific phosphodiesterase class I)
MAEDLKAIIVDHDTESLAYLEKLFQDVGFSVQTTRKVRSLRYQLRPRPDLIVLELIMPGRDGVQIIDALAKAKVSSAILIVSACPERVLSAAESFARMSGLKVLGHVRKPVYQDQLALVLDPMLAAGRTKPHIEEQEFFRLLESGSLVNYYEPIIDAQVGAVQGLEALARLNHPTQGLMSPVGFWDTAEAYAAYPIIQEGLLRNAVADAMEFRTAGYQIPITCNVPATQIGEPDFADKLLDRCRKANLLPTNLCIDVTESDMRQNFVPALGSLTRLCMRGVQLTIDDYGSGSLTGGMLARLPAQELKLSQQLVASTLNNGDARNRVIDVVEYCKAHELRIVAKGVETEEHLGLMMDLGVFNFQGAVFTSARAPKEMIYWLKSSHRSLGELGIISHLREVPS